MLEMDCKAQWNDKYAISTILYFESIVKPVYNKNWAEPFVCWWLLYAGLNIIEKAQME